jgi:hypothetical protein
VVSDWGAHASRVLVPASRRNELSQALLLILDLAASKVRDGEDAIANTRDTRAPQKSARLRRKARVSIFLLNICQINLDNIIVLN